MNDGFIACMEDVLHLYSLPYDRAYPVLCFDERPCFLIGDTVAPIQMRVGNSVKKINYEYTKHGSCALLVAIEPLTGTRFAKVFNQRRKQEYAQFMDYLAQQYPEAKQIKLVQDNLNTHTKSSFYSTFQAEKAFELGQKFDMHFTPLKGSWLNMVEIELSAISKQALNQRIPDKKTLEKQVEAIVKERNQKQIKINWQFSVENARDKLNRF